MNLDLRNTQAKALTGKEGDEHPFIFAEQGPNRYQSITWFFPEEDGVRVEEDLDLGERKVIYFDFYGFEQVITAGAVYEWAINQYDNN